MSSRCSRSSYGNFGKFFLKVPIVMPSIGIMFPISIGDSGVKVANFLNKMGSLMLVLSKFCK